MYDTKPLVPQNDSRKIHLRDLNESPTFIDGDPRYKGRYTDGYSLFKSLCGRSILSKQNIIGRFNIDDICNSCIVIAQQSGVDFSEFIDE